MRDIDWTKQAPCVVAIGVLDCSCPPCVERGRHVAATVVRLVLEFRGLRPIYDDNSIAVATGLGGSAGARRLAEVAAELDLYDTAIQLLTELPVPDVWELADEDPVAFADALPNAADIAPCVRIYDEGPTCECSEHRRTRDESLAGVVEGVLQLRRVLRDLHPTAVVFEADVHHTGTWLQAALGATVDDIAGLETLWMAGLTAEQAWHALQLVRTG